MPMYKLIEITFPDLYTRLYLICDVLDSVGVEYSLDEDTFTVDNNDFETVENLITQAVA